MKFTDEDVRLIRQWVDQLIGMRAWSVRTGYGTSVFFEFGAPLRSESVIAGDDPLIRGEWRLWIHMSVWRLETATEFLAGAEGTQEDLDAAVKQMENVPIIAIDFELPALDIILTFENGLIFRVFPMYPRDKSPWTLFIPGGKSLSTNREGYWTYYERTSDFLPPWTYFDGSSEYKDD